jgi:hypothetical protein
MRTFPPVGDEWVEGIKEYEKTLPLLEEERAFFYSHLAQPHFFYRCIHEYEAKRQHEKSEREYVAELQRHYLAMKNTEYIVMRLVQQKEAEDAKSIPDEAPPQ